jgi:hypothetical protein
MQLVWYEQTNGQFRYAASSARNLYVSILDQVLQPKIFKKAMALPIGLPPSAGGISFPFDFEYIRNNHNFELRFLTWLVKEASLDQFMVFSTKMQDTVGRLKRALETPSFSSVYSDTIRRVIDRLNILSDRDQFDPLDTNCLVPLNSALEYIRLFEDVPISSVTGFPQVQMSLDLLYKKHGYISIEFLDNLLERGFTFMKACRDGPKRAVPLSFSAYVSNLSRFWLFVRTDCSHLELPENTFKDIDSVHWSIAKRRKILIHKSNIGNSMLAHMPTLHLELYKEPIGSLPLEDETFFSPALENAAESYLNSLRDLDEDQMMANAV